MVDPNWVAAIGQGAGALLTMVAAGMAWRTAKTAERVAKQGVEATERQTSLAAMQELWRDYASAEMYKALKKFGPFFGDDAQRRERFTRIGEQFKKNGRTLDYSDDFTWIVQALENDVNLGAARREIHHYFKRIWAMRRAKAVSDPDLLLLTSAHSGYDLWRDGVLPATIALGRGRSFARTEEWPRELVEWVEKAAHAPATRSARME